MALHNFLSQQDLLGLGLPYNFQFHGQSMIRDPQMTMIRGLADHHCNRPRPSSCDTEYIYCIRLPISCPKASQLASNSDTKESLFPRLASQCVQFDHWFGTSIQKATGRHHPYSRHCPVRAAIIRQRQTLPSTSYRISPGTVGSFKQQKVTRPQEVVKVGKTDNPARRFHEIFGAFQNLGLTEPLLQVIERTDEPKVVLEKVKKQKISSVVFLMEVQAQGIETAEEYIRGCLGVPLSGQGFKESFLKSLADDEQKKRFESDAGMSEWILMDSALATDLQWKFHYNMLYLKPDIQRDLEILSGVLQPPSGSDLWRQLRSHHLDYACQNRNSSRPSKVTISLPDQLPNFSYTVNT